MGKIVDKHSGERIRLPVSNETAVMMQPEWRFESTMSEVSEVQVRIYCLMVTYVLIPLSSAIRFSTSGSTQH